MTELQAKRKRVRAKITARRVSSSAAAVAVPRAQPAEGALAALPERLAEEHVPQAAADGTEAAVVTPRAAGVAPEPVAREERGPPPPVVARYGQQAVVVTAPDGPLAPAVA